ncbi:MAG: hypothetical protein DRG30_06975 [Epsilonproteobacteria bacterium]|nr:MAG: hypothetical protein DRG30_06975 [Campylobacterota bacterium]
MILIQDYISSKLETRTYQQLADEVHISPPMITNYKKGHYNPSIKTALSVFELDNVTLHPYSEESLQYELEKR